VRFMRATGVSRVSYSKISEYFLRVTAGAWDEICA
jgi:hypothetical protein